MKVTATAPPWVHELTRLEADLAAAKERAQTARREALEEAARIMDDLAAARKDNLGSGYDYERGARRIRALIDQEPQS